MPALFAVASLAGAAIGHATVSSADMPHRDRPAPAQADDFAEGYRWASLVGADDAGQCPGDSWSFTRGCRAYLLTSGAGE